MKKLLILLLLVLCVNSTYSIHARYFKDIQSQKSMDMGYNYLDLSGSKEVSKDELDKNYCYMFIYEDEDDSLIKVHYIQNGRISYIPQKNYSTISLSYEDGFETRAFSDPFGNSVQNEWGIHIIRTKLDDQGRYLKSFNYDKESKLVDDKNGICMYGFNYDEEGRLSDIRSFDKKNKKVQEKGYYMIQFSYQDKENTVTKTYLDSKKNKTANIYGVVYEKIYSISTNGYSVNQFSYFDKNFKRIVHNGLQAHTVIQIINDYDNTLETRYYNTSEELISAGVAVIKYKLDKNRHVESISYFNKNNKASEKEGIHRIEYKNDKYGNVLKLSYYNQDNDLIPVDGDIAQIKYKYNKYGDMLEKRFFGIDERPTTDEEGIHSYAYQYNDRGQDVQIATYDLKGELQEDAKGYAKYHKTYDVYGRLTLIKHFGKFDQLKADKDGVAYTSIHYLKNGKIQYFQYDLAGKVIESYYE